MKKIFALFLILITTFSFSQDDLLSELEQGVDSSSVATKTAPAFKALQIVTAQSTKIAAKKDLYFIVSHRFGDVSNGFDEFFGLDNATTRIGFIYGLTDYLSLNISRHTYQKTWEFGAKYKVISQKENHSPITLVGYNVIGINSELEKEVYPRLDFQDRLSYVSQILISRRFSEKFSAQITPSYIHKNLITEGTEKENQFSIGAGGRFKLSPRLSLNAEYFYNINQPDPYKNPLSIGLDIETGGHVFQLLFSNAQPMTEAGYLTNGLGEWEKGKIYFGFNLYRVF